MPFPFPYLYHVVEVPRCRYHGQRPRRLADGHHDQPERDEVSLREDRAAEEVGRQGEVGATRACGLENQGRL